MVSTENMKAIPSSVGTTPHSRVRDASIEALVSEARGIFDIHEEIPVVKGNKGLVFGSPDSGIWITSRSLGGPDYVLVINNARKEYMANKFLTGELPTDGTYSGFSYQSTGATKD